jgi:hypothetical protein
MSRHPETGDRRRTLSPLSVVAIVALGLLWLARFSRTPLFARLTSWAAATSRWDRLPVPLALATILIYRNRLRRENLYDTETAATRNRPVQEGERHLTARTADGTYNDLGAPRMGSAGTRFGRNVPIDRTHPDYERLMQPNPRTVSSELLTRETFLPATTLNLLAAAWIQFMLRDWVSHGKSPKENPWEVPLADEDPWPERPMRILRTQDDPTRTPEEGSVPSVSGGAETGMANWAGLRGAERASGAFISHEAPVKRSRLHRRGRTVLLQEDLLTQPVLA